MTLTNAVFLTTLVARDSFGDRAAHVTPRRLCMTTGAANIILAPLGALPMCHGAGGVAAHHRFGARSGGAPVMLGAALLLLALLPGDLQRTALGTIPAATLGALLLVAAIELATSRRLLDARPSCRPVIALTAFATVFGNPLLGLGAGTLAEIVRKALIARYLAKRDSVND
jgi:MFS superfamily sulfate permease-like transporter